MQMNENDISEEMVHYVLTLDTQELSTLTSQKVAEVFGLNSKEVNRAFASTQELSLDQFIMREKMYRAFFIIERNSEISLNQLAREMGFYSLRDFEKEFETLLLIHPARYKELFHVSH